MIDEESIFYRVVDWTIGKMKYLNIEWWIRKWTKKRKERADE